jgi:hypothetical protein
MTVSEFSEIEFDGVTAPLIVRGGTEGIVLPADFCIDDLLGFTQEVELSLDVESSLAFDPGVGEFVLEGAAFEVIDTPECDDDFD